MLRELGVSDVLGVLVGVLEVSPLLFRARDATVGEEKCARSTRGSGDVVARGVTGRDMLDRKLTLEVLERKLAREVVEWKLACEVVDCMLSRLDMLDRGLLVWDMVPGRKLLDWGVLGRGAVSARRGVLGRGIPDFGVLGMAMGWGVLGREMLEMLEMLSRDMLFGRGILDREAPRRGELVGVSLGELLWEGICMKLMG